MCVYLVQPIDSGGTDRGKRGTSGWEVWYSRAGRTSGKGGVKGKGKVRDKRLENGIGHPHACRVFFKGGQICEGWGRGGWRAL